MKKFVINGKDIQGAGVWDDGKGNYGVRGAEVVVNELLEALSDKEESKLGSFAGTFCGKNIYFECEDKKIWDNFQKALQSRTFLYEEPKQEECKHVGSFSLTDKRGIYICDGCGRKTTHEEAVEFGNKSKQSISLKDTLVREFRVNCADQVMGTGGLADFDKAIEHIISLLQSHLVKEIEYKFYGANDPKVKDIIKIINTL